MRGREVPVIYDADLQIIEVRGQGGEFIYFVAPGMSLFFEKLILSLYHLEKYFTINGIIIKVFHYKFKLSKVLKWEINGKSRITL